MFISFLSLYYIMNKSDVKCFRFLCKPIHNDFFHLFRFGKVMSRDAMAVVNLGQGKFWSYTFSNSCFISSWNKKYLLKQEIDRFSLIAMSLMPKSAIKQNTSKQMQKKERKTNVMMDMGNWLSIFVDNNGIDSLVFCWHFCTCQIVLWVQEADE